MHLSGGFTVLSTKAFSTLLTMEWFEIFTEWITYPVVAVSTGSMHQLYLTYLPSSGIGRDRRWSDSLSQPSLDEVRQQGALASTTLLPNSFTFFLPPDCRAYAICLFQPFRHRRISYPVWRFQEGYFPSNCHLLVRLWCDSRRGVPDILGTYYCHHRRYR